MRRDSDLSWEQLSLIGFFLTCLIISNITAAKIVAFHLPGVEWQFFVPAAVFAYALTFFATDAYGELYGKRAAQRLVIVGFGMNVVMVGLIYIAIKLPAAPFYQLDKAFSQILGAAPRIVLASMVAYLISQNHDVWAFHMWRKLTKGRHLWFRNTASTTVSQAIDTIIFITIAFYGTMPLDSLLVMIGSQYVVKLLVALGDTPLVYAVVGLTKKRIINIFEEVEAQE
jgi:hypothetical protein